MIHPLVSRGGIVNNRGFGGVGGYAAAHTGAVNLRDCYSGWFEPRGTVTMSQRKGFGSIGRKGGVKLVSTTITSPISSNFSTSGGGGNGEKEKRTTHFPKGTSPIEVISWVRSIFTDKYLNNLQKRFESEVGEGSVPNTPISPEVRMPSGGLGGEAAVIVDDEAWDLWKNDREELRRRVEEVRKAGLEGGGVYGEWEAAGGGGDVPIRFLDLDRAALDTIKENLGRRFEGAEGE